MNTVSKRRSSFCGFGLCRIWIALLVLVGGCDTGPADSLWDPDAPSGPEPVISEVDPPDVALAGVDVVTIRGQNFGSSPEANVIFFNATRVTILSASSTEITVQAPNLSETAVLIRVSVVGNDAESFSNGYELQLLPAAEEFGDLLSIDKPFGLAAGEDNSIYVSMFEGEISAGIDRFSSDGERTDFSGTTFRWDGIDLGSDGSLYGVRNVRAVFRFPPEGGREETWAVESTASVRFVDIDFDASGNAWAAGPNENLFRIAPDKTITPFPFVASVEALKIVGGTLYALVTGASGGEIWSFTIDGAGDLSGGTLFADLSAHTQAEVFALEAAANGDLFVGTDDPNPVWVVHADGSAEPLYPGVLTMKALSLAWGEGAFLMMSQGAVNDDAPRIIKINTRLEGVR